MYDHLYLLPTLPILACLALVTVGWRWSQRTVAWVGVAPVALAAGFAVAMALRFFTTPSHGGAVRQLLWTWLAVGSFRVEVALRLDPLAVVMVTTVAVVSFLVLLYATDYMAGDEGFARFFATMNLFVAAMLVLVLADNLLLLYLGWEGVGLCSFLLIGFWRRDPANVRAAWKAFLITRIGDVALLIGIVLLGAMLGTLDIPGVQAAAGRTWAAGSTLPVLVAGLMLVAAVAKSAQWPLHAWLPDAMVGPTPVSALIHAATMVTAGVYLLVRLDGLLALAPPVRTAAVCVGVGTMLLGGLAALAQTDLKRALAYSTMSQLGLMFLAVGAGATAAATFHLVTHAVFKGLLFLATGSVMLAVGHSSDMRRMGGLRRALPLVYVAFVVGASALAGLPFFSGFFSKEAILRALWLRGDGGPMLWTVGVAGAFLTSLYAFTLVFRVFHGPAPSRDAGVSPAPTVPAGRTFCLQAPLLVLSVLAVLAGYGHKVSTAAPWALQWVAAAAAMAGVPAAWWMVHRPRIDGALTRVSRYTIADRAWRTIANTGLTIGDALTNAQTGRVRWYAATLVAGAVLALLLAVVV